MENRKGSTLAMTLMVFSVLMIFGTFILSFMVTENKQSLHHQYKTQAYYLARGGAEAVEVAIREAQPPLNSKIDQLISVNTKGQLVELELKIEELSVFLTIEKEKDKNNLLINSSATVSGVESTVDKVISFTSGGKLEEWFDTPIYTSGTLSMEKNPKIYPKDIILSEDTDFESDDFNIQNKNREYPKINIEDKIGVKIFENIPEILNILAKPKSEINQNIIFTADKVEFNNLIVNALDENIDIIIDNDLVIKNKLIISGNNKVRIFIKGKLKIDDKSDINKTGNNNNLEIIYLGKNELKINEKSEIWANIFVNDNEEIVIEDKVVIHGDIFLNNSEAITIKEDVVIHGDIFLNNSKEINIEEDVVIHGDVFINNSKEINIEEKVVIHGSIFVNNSEKITIDDKVNINGLVYAPNVDIRCGEKSEIYGLIGKNIDVDEKAKIGIKDAQTKEEYKEEIMKLIPDWVKDTPINSQGSDGSNIFNKSHHR